MSVDFFGVSLEKQRKLDNEIPGISNKEIDDLLTAHKFLNLATLKKIHDIDLARLNKLLQIDPSKISAEFKQNLKSFLKHKDVKLLLLDGVFDKDKQYEKLAKVFDEFIKTKGYSHFTKEEIGNIIFDVKDSYKSFNSNFKAFLEKSTEIKDYLKTLIPANSDIQSYLEKNVKLLKKLVLPEDVDLEALLDSIENYDGRIRILEEKHKIYQPKNDIN